MENDKIAPEPWSFDARTGQIRDRHGSVVATLNLAMPGVSVERTAWLIASAPTLLDACRYSVKTIRMREYTDEEDFTSMLTRCWRAYLQPAINKADEGHG